MSGRARLSPYYFVSGEKTELAGILATICPADKKVIHGMKDAVMVPCARHGTSELSECIVHKSRTLEPFHIDHVIIHISYGTYSLSRGLVSRLRGGAPETGGSPHRIRARRRARLSPDAQSGPRSLRPVLCSCPQGWGHGVDGNRRHPRSPGQDVRSGTGSPAANRARQPCSIHSTAKETAWKHGDAYSPTAS